jgi:hypothetical protein
LDGAPPKGSNRRAARDLLGELLERGWVTLYWSEEPDGKLSPIPSEQSTEVLNDEKLSDAPSGWHRVVRVSATPAGEAAYEAAAKH